MWNGDQAVRRPKITRYRRCRRIDLCPSDPHPYDGVGGGEDACPVDSSEHGPGDSEAADARRLDRHGRIRVTVLADDVRRSDAVRELWDAVDEETHVDGIDASYARVCDDAVLDEESVPAEDSHRL